MPSRPSRVFSVSCCLLVATIASVSAAAQDGRTEVQIKTIPVRDHVYMLEGRGGNIGLSIGEDGAFLIDDQFAPLTPQILAAVGELTDQPVRFLINTHWHSDHTGGNENLGERGAIIVAHDNVRKRLSEDQFMEAFNRTSPALPVVALPVITFDDSVTFHWNDDTIRVIHVKPAHTDGDSIIHFADANVVHMGDVYFSGGYPFIDLSSDGSINGVINAVERVLDRTNEETKFIPGHGEVTGVADLRMYHDVLVTLRDRIQNLIDEGKSRDEVIEAKPTAEYDAEWGGGFMQPNQWVGIVYDSLTAT